MKKLTNFKPQSVICKLFSAIFLSVCIIFSICVYHSFADVPCMINYQGRLIKDNVPVDGTKTMVFSIYDGLEGGSELWTSGNVDITVYNGLFRYVIGSDEGDLSSIDWTAGQELYLEVKVGTDILTPREEIYAYPYAINSHLLEGSTKEYFINVSGETQQKDGGLNIMGNVGIGTTSPGRLLDVNGVVKAQAALLEPVNPNNINNPVDGMIACDSNDNTIKQYDSSIADWKPVGGGFGDWLDVTEDASGGATQGPVTTDGFVSAYSAAAQDGAVIGYQGRSSPDTAIIYDRFNTAGYSNRASITMPVPKGCYWKVTGATKVYWIPLGN